MVTRSLPEGTKRAIEDAALDWLGVPFLHQGRTRAGIDCAGLVIVVAKSLGLSDYDIRTYSQRATGANMLKPFDARMDIVPIAELDGGDVLVTRDEHERFPCHCGIVVRRAGSTLGFVHAWVRRGRVCESLLSDWLRWTVRGYRFRVNDEGTR